MIYPDEPEYDRIAKHYEFLFDEIQVIYSYLFEIDTAVTLGHCIDLMKHYHAIVDVRQTEYGIKR
jgi:hypothetical protein